LTTKNGSTEIIQVWREIDVRITRYHVEACDNAKFLGAIEKSSHAIYLEVCFPRLGRTRGLYEPAH
jgi:hypothetical protein